MSEPAKRYYKTLSDNMHLQTENARLKARVERLTKAGDEMAFHYQELVRIEWGNMTTHIAPSIVRWNAAKEGKGQP